ncbi:MAG: cobalamin biosynthetic protein CobC [Rhodospirillaceae bacterium]|nr:MAG: cobalamin biosynthetic protein CobC [Rhodospirillaceae bacterium]
MNTCPVMPRHGGDWSAAQAQFGRRPWLDLSTGINPWPYPIPEETAEDWTRLPAADQHRTLCAIAARCYGAGPETAVVAAPGTQALIQWLPYLAGRESLRVAVLEPTYAEHAAAWSAAGHEVVPVNSLTDIAAVGASVAVVVNPNNPDGRSHPPESLCALTRTLRLLVVDEAFADVRPDVSVIPLVPHPPCLPERIVVLRSFGKFFGLAGVRLGFAITGPLFAARLEAALGPWAVGGVAVRLGIRALSDEAWQAATRTRLHAAAARLDAVLTAAGLTVTGGTDLFRFVVCERARDVYEQLGRAGILVRAFPHLPLCLRWGLPGRAQDWFLLREALDLEGQDILL